MSADKNQFLNFILLLLPAIPVFVLLGVWIDSIILKRQKGNIYNNAINIWWRISNYQIRNLAVQTSASISKIIVNHKKKGLALYFLKIVISSCILTFVFYYLGVLICIEKDIYVKNALQLVHSPNWKIVVLNILTDIITILVTIRIIALIAQKKTVNILICLVGIGINWLLMTLVATAIIISFVNDFNSKTSDYKVALLKEFGMDSALDSTMANGKIYFPIKTNLNQTIIPPLTPGHFSSEDTSKVNFIGLKLTGINNASMSNGLPVYFDAFFKSQKIMVDIIKHGSEAYQINTRVYCGFAIPNEYKLNSKNNKEQQNIHFDIPFPIIISYDSLLLASTSFIPTILLFLLIFVLFLGKIVLSTSRFSISHVIEVATENVTLHEIKQFRPFTLFGRLIGVVLIVIILILLILNVIL